MAAHVTSSRKGLRRLERATGEQVVWSTGPWITTTDHRHFVWDGADWHPIPDQEAAATILGYSPCGLPTALSSCEWLFGEPEFGFTRGLMRGPCRTCGVGCSELHLWDCAKLSSLMDHVNPDYWPRPVHRPMWLDDPRRTLDPGTRPLVLLALGLDIPFELVLYGGTRQDWADWERRAAAEREQFDLYLQAVADQIGPPLVEAFGLDPGRYRVQWQYEESP